MVEVPPAADAEDRRVSWMRSPSSSNVLGELVGGRLSRSWILSRSASASPPAPSSAVSACPAR